MARRTSMRVHDVYPNQGLDRALLVLAFAGGVFGGLVLKLAGAHPFIAAGYSATVLCFYAAAAYSATGLRLEPETIGDNCYYLGFLFTLSSLATTLYFIVESDAQTRSDLIPGVISGFGVALSSTIVGVFLRVLMMQLRVDLVSREHETRVGLNMAARELRTEMARSLQQVKSFTVESLQHAREREAALQKITDNMAREAQQKIGDFCAATKAEIEASAREQTGAAISGIRELVENASREMVGIAASGAKDLRSQAETIQEEKQHALNAIVSYREAIKNAYLRLAEQNRELTDDAKKTVEAGAAAVAAILAQSEASSAALSAVVEQQHSAVEAAKTSREQVTRSLRTFNEAIRRVGQTTEGSLQASSEQLFAAVDKATDEIQRSASKASVTIVEQTLIATENSLQSAANHLSTATERATQVVLRAADQAGATIIEQAGVSVKRSLRSASDRMQNEVSRAADEVLGAAIKAGETITGQAVSSAEGSFESASKRLTAAADKAADEVRRAAENATATMLEYAKMSAEDVSSRGHSHNPNNDVDAVSPLHLDAEATQGSAAGHSREEAAR